MKTDKTKNWTDSWKEQLDEYSVTPPPEVWEELFQRARSTPYLLLEKNHLVGSCLYYTFRYVLLSGYNSSVRLPT